MHMLTFLFEKVTEEEIATTHVEVQKSWTLCKINAYIYILFCLILEFISGLDFLEHRNVSVQYRKDHLRRRSLFRDLGWNLLCSFV